MLPQQNAAVLLYGNSVCLEMIECQLRRNLLEQADTQLAIMRIDPRQPVAARQLPNLQASILIYDCNNTDTDLISAFMLKNPHTPIISLGPQNDQAELFSAGLSTHRELRGLAQVLQVICDQ